MAQPDFDMESAHKFFAADCFNKAWELIEKKERTPEDNRQMILLNQASIWHWTQRKECTSRNLSIGYWQAARIYALLGDSDNARQAGELSRSYTSAEEPFYLGYAYEALARAELVADNREKAKAHLEEARTLAGRVSDADSKQWLTSDLDEIAGRLG